MDVIEIYTVLFICYVVRHFESSGNSWTPSDTGLYSSWWENPPVNKNIWLPSFQLAQGSSVNNSHQYGSGISAASCIVWLLQRISGYPRGLLSNLLISFVSSSKHQVNPYLYWKLDFHTEGISLEMSWHLCSTIKCQLLWVWLLPETD